MADLVVMGLDEHDRLIAFVLGLSHALNIAFFTALAESGEAAPRLARMSSTTFDAQLDVATRVAAENPDLYYEIQSLNDYGVESLNALQAAVEPAVPLRARGRCAGLRRDDATRATTTCACGRPRATRPAAERCNERDTRWQLQVLAWSNGLMAARTLDAARRRAGAASRPPLANR